MTLAYVGCKTAQIYIVDIDNFLVLTTINVTGLSYGQIAINSTGSRVYRSTTGGGLNVVDAIAGVELTTISLGSGGYARYVVVHPNDKLIYVTREDCTISVVSADSNSVVATFDATVPGVNGVLYGLAVSPDGALLYVSFWDSDIGPDDYYVKYISTDSGATLSTIAMQDYFPHDEDAGDILPAPMALNVTPDGSLLYITTAGGRVGFDDLYSALIIAGGRVAAVLEIIAGEDAPNQGYGVQYSPDGSICYIANLSDWINIYDTFSGSLLLTKSTSNIGTDLAVSADGSRVCVTHHTDIPDSVEVIDVASATTTGFVLLPSGANVGEIEISHPFLNIPGPHVFSPMGLPGACTPKPPC
jgi:DNA-binding beta-propeller fold protein YncE